MIVSTTIYLPMHFVYITNIQSLNDGVPLHALLLRSQACTLRP